MSRGHYVGDELQDTEHSWIHTAVVLGIGVGLGWLWAAVEAKRQLKHGANVSDIEAAIRTRGRDSRHYGLSGR